jgi:hypothetical protein
MHIHYGDVAEDLGELSHTHIPSDPKKTPADPGSSNVREGDTDTTDLRLLKIPGLLRNPEKVPFRVAQENTDLEIIVSGDDHYLARCGEEHGTQFYELRFHPVLAGTLTEDVVAEMVSTAFQSSGTASKLQPSDPASKIARVISRSGLRPDHSSRLRKDAEELRFVADGVGILGKSAWSGGLWVFSHAIPALVRSDPEIYGHHKIDIAVGNPSKSTKSEVHQGFEFAFINALKRLMPDRDHSDGGSGQPCGQLQHQNVEELKEPPARKPFRSSSPYVSLADAYLDRESMLAEDTPTEGSPKALSPQRVQLLEEELRRQGKIK